jgi:hypothetical protein
VLVVRYLGIAKVSSLDVALLAGLFGIASLETGSPGFPRHLQQYDVQLRSSDTGQPVAGSAWLLAENSKTPNAPEEAGSGSAAKPGQQSTETVNYTDGGKYRGQLQDRKRHGFGTYFYPNGAQYRGNWKRDKKHGAGTFTWPSGNVFVGEWREGVQNGSGIFTWADGGEVVGTWKDGILQEIDN